MTATTLSSVTLKTLENYRSAAAQTVAAYRQGSHRLLGLVNGALENSVYPRTAKLAPRATQRLDQARGKASEIVVKGIDALADRTEQLIDRGSSAAAAQLGKVAALTAGIDNEVLANGLQTAARLAVPGAQVVLAVSGRLAEGASALAGAAGVRPLRSTARKATRKTAPVARKAAPVARKAKVGAKSVTQRVRKVVEAEVAAPARKRRAPRAVSTPA